MVTVVKRAGGQEGRTIIIRSRFNIDLPSLVTASTICNGSLWLLRVVNFKLVCSLTMTVKSLTNLSILEYNLYQYGMKRNRLVRGGLTLHYSDIATG